MKRDSQRRSHEILTRHLNQHRFGPFQRGRSTRRLTDTVDRCDICSVVDCRKVEADRRIDDDGSESKCESVQLSSLCACDFLCNHLHRFTFSHRHYRD